MIDFDARTDEILSEINAAVAASQLGDKSDILITADGREVTRTYSPAAGAIVVYPTPGLDWTAPRTTKLTWTIAVVALVQDDPRAGLRRIGELLEVLKGIIRFGDRAIPTDFKLDDNTTIPGYTITHIEEHRS